MPRRKRASASEPLSGYRLMWMMVMFDLPVDSDANRKSANDFRFYLKDLGFEMAQYSIYMRYASGSSQCESFVDKIQQQLPVGGKVYVHCLTDKQYEKIIRFENRKRQSLKPNPEQYQLF